MVSVIIPNYNHAPYIKQRIDSVINQTHQNFEVIILDDASTDNSREIIELYREHEKVQFIVYNEVNSGTTFKQWQRGIQLARGKHIWIAESDDYCHERFLESAVNNLKKYNSGLHYCQSHLVDENNKILEYTLKWPESITSINWKQPFFMSGREFIKKGLQYKNIIPNASAVVFTKCEFDFNQLNKYKTCGDWLFWIKFLLSSNISYSAEILNSFRSHSNTTRNLNTHRKTILRYFEELSVKYNLSQKYNLGEKAEMKRVLKLCIDVSKISDICCFAKFSIKFRLPGEFVFQFLIRKVLVNRFTLDYLQKLKKIKIWLKNRILLHE